MAKIIFRIFPIESHHNATYYLASQLVLQGYQVIYVGNKEIQAAVTRQGFDFYVLKDDIFSPVTGPGKQQAEVRQSPAEKFQAYLSGEQFDEVINELKPDLVIVDSSYTRHVISLYPRQVPFIILETMVNPNKGKFNPPLNAAVIPEPGLVNAIYIQWLWGCYFLKRRLLATMGILMPIRKLAHKIGFPVSAIRFDRYFQVGLDNYPEFILTPREFDFQLKKRDNQFYTGASIAFERQPAAKDPAFDNLLQQLIADRKNPERDQKVIYCSFGGMAWRYKGIEAFWEKLVDEVKKRVNWTLIISSGTGLKTPANHGKCSNVHIFHYVAQVELLKHCDLVITHGGINTIIECINNSVPMLVYPGTNDLDQNGNAARVVHHQIGLRGSLLEDSPLDVSRKFETILNDGAWVENVKALKATILSNEEPSLALDIIAKEIQKGKKSRNLLPLN